MGEETKKTQQKSNDLFIKFIDNTHVCVYYRECHSYQRNRGPMCHSFSMKLAMCSIQHSIGITKNLKRKKNKFSDFFSHLKVVLIYLQNVHLRPMYHRIDRNRLNSSYFPLCSYNCYQIHKSSIVTIQT